MRGRFGLFLIIITTIALVVGGFFLWQQYYAAPDKGIVEGLEITAVDEEATATTQDNPDKILPLDAYNTKIPKTGKFVVVDLAREIVELYQDGELFDTADIRSQGQAGSFWQTPTGYYEITYTNPNHLSSIGNVYMPNSLQYSGNFFLHGWPTYLDGTPVEEGYSGGCIRLGTEDSKKVFDFTPSGSKVLVINSDNLISKDHKINKDQIDQIKNQISGGGYLVANLVTGEVIASDYDRDELLPLGSISNFLVAIVTNEWISYGTQVPQYKSAADQSYYSTGTTIVPRDMYPQLLTDSTEAADINYSISKFRGRWFFNDITEEKMKAIAMDEAVITTDPESNQPLEFSAPLDEWFHLVRYLHFQKQFLLENSDGLYQDESLQYFSTQLPDGTESGFAIISIENSDSIGVIVHQTDDFAGLAQNIHNTLIGTETLAKEL